MNPSEISDILFYLLLSACLIVILKVIKRHFFFQVRIGSSELHRRLESVARNAGNGPTQAITASHHPREEDGGRCCQHTLI